MMKLPAEFLTGVNTSFIAHFLFTFILRHLFRAINIHCAVRIDWNTYFSNICVNLSSFEPRTQNLLIFFKTFLKMLRFVYTQINMTLHENTILGPFVPHGSKVALDCFFFACFIGSFSNGNILFETNSLFGLCFVRILIF